MTYLLISTLESLGFPVIQQGSIGVDEAYPNSFITFQTTGSPEQDFFDGSPWGTQWRFSVIFYTCDPILLSTVPKQIYTALKDAGFIPQGKGYDIPSDEPGWNGWVNDYHFLEV